MQNVATRSCAVGLRRSDVATGGRGEAVYGGVQRASPSYAPLNEGARVVARRCAFTELLFQVEAGPDARRPIRRCQPLPTTLEPMPDEGGCGGGERRSETAEGASAKAPMLGAPWRAGPISLRGRARFDRVINAVKGRGFAAFTPELAAAMAEETRTLLHHLVWDDRNFMEALTAEYSFLTSELASLYGVPAPEGQFEMAKFPAGSKRAGLLGQGTFLASTAGPTATSPTARGIFVRERLLCQHVPPPPPGVITTLPDPIADQPPKGRRQLMNEHVENPTCASCHRLMDPIGFGFEHFDAIGKWRDKELIPVPGRRGGGGGGGGRGGPPPVPVDSSPGEIAVCPIRASRARGSSARFWRKALFARNASSARCSDTPMGGLKQPRMRRRLTGFLPGLKSRGSVSRIC